LRIRSEAGTSRPRFKAALLAAPVGCALLAALAAGSSANSNGRYPGNDPDENGANPCTGPEQAELLCPNLRMSKPSHLVISKSPSGRRLLHAQSSVNSRGQGPMEIRGIRIPGTRLMRVNQRIHRKGGGKLVIPTQGRLAFYPVPGQYRYWKFRDAARFEIWTVDGQGLPKTQIRTGPKFYYCLRDLERTKPSRHSPGHRVYPGCNQNPNKRGGAGDLGRLVRHLPRRLPRAVRQCHRPARLLRVLHGGRPEEPPARVERERQPLTRPGPPSFQTARAPLLTPHWGRPVVCEAGLWGGWLPSGAAGRPYNY
jgi:hypothetical protein